MKDNLGTERKTEGTNNSFLNIEHWQVISIYLVIYDIVAVTMSYFLALWFRFDCSYSLIWPEYLEAWKLFALPYAVICVVVFTLCRLYRSIWRFASYTELTRVILATVITCGLHTILITAFLDRMPISYYLMGMAFQFLAVLGIRFSYRFVLLMRARNKKGRKVDNVMLIGMSNIIRVT